MAKFDGIILDVDGTLGDSNAAHTRAYVEAMHECGFPQATFEQIRPLIGMGGDQLLPRAIGVEKESDAGKAVLQKRAEIFKSKYQGAIKPTPGASDLTARLKADRFRLIVASSGEEDEVEAALKTAGVRQNIDLLVTGKDAPKSKPHPMAVQVALDKANLSPDKAFFLGDTPWDAEAGKRRASVFVPCAAAATGTTKNCAPTTFSILPPICWRITPKYLKPLEVAP